MSSEVSTREDDENEIHFSDYIDHQNPQWITTNMKKRECNRFTQVKTKDSDGASSDDPMCQCGKKKIQHPAKYLVNSDHNLKWKVKTHTVTSDTDAYGDIIFEGAAGAGQGQKIRKYVRTDHSTKPKILLDLIQKQWNLSGPKLLISVTGGASNFPLNSRLKDVFRKGLIKIAISTGAWIITGGTNCGVMKYVGEAVRDYAIAEGDTAASHVIAIGIATWGVLDQKDVLLTENHQNGRAFYHMNTDASYMSNGNRRPRLDPNHTHFILVDNGSTDDFGKEIILRSKLEKEISEQKVTGEKDKKLNVPSICVVVEGGPNTIQTVYEAIKHGTPTLIVAGSGKAADIMAVAFNEKARRVQTKKIKGKNEECFVISTSVLGKVSEMLTKAFGEKHLEMHLTRIKECAEKPHLINVYELDAKQGVANDIDRAILRALLKANKGNVIDQLQLALVWNRVDVAKTEIFTDDQDWIKGQLDSCVRYAIVHNLPDFVDLFIDKGVSMKDYLTEAELTLLYNKIKDTTLLYDLLFKQSKIKDGDATLWAVGKIIQALTMDTYKPLYLTDQRRFRVTQSSPSVAALALQNGGKNNMLEHSSDKMSAEYNPIRELFLYSILLNRKEMARLLWEQIDEAVAAALTASKMLRGMASKEDDIDQSENMKKHAAEYEELAIGVLNECYDQEEDRSLIMMIRELPNWGNSTCLSLAVQAQNRNFIAQSAVQHLLTQIWMGKISDENNYWKLWLCMFFPPAVYLSVWFREDESQNTAMHNVKYTPQPQVKDHVSQDDQIAESSVMVRMDNKNGTVSSAEHETDTEVSADHYTQTADVDIRDSGRKLGGLLRLKLFYSAPIIKFRLNVLAYFGFLFLFSYIMLTNFNEKVSWQEYLLVGWVATLYIEEFRQIAHGESNSWWHRILHWITDFWNMVDVATLLLFGIGLILRFIPHFLGAARIVLSLDLMVFYMRLLQSFSVSKNLGPKLIMIARMMVDLLFFVCILAVFLIAYGISSYAIMFPNESDPRQLFTGIFYHPYFQMYGELFLESIEGEGCSANETLIEMGEATTCPEYSWMGLLLLSGYMMLSNVLLLNLLIAMFSYTFSHIQDNTDTFWKFQRYEVINEFFGRPPFPPPLIVISHMYFFVRFIMKKCCCRWCPVWSAGKLRTILNVNEVKQYILWEGINADNFITKQKQKSQENLDERMKITCSRVQTMTVLMDTLIGDSDGIGGPLSVGKTLDNRLARIEDQLERTNKAIDWIILSLSENKLSTKEGLPELKAIQLREDEAVSSEDEEIVYEVPTTIEELGIAIHGKARTSPYPGTARKRFHVRDSKVPWAINFPKYKPLNFTHDIVLAMPHWADQDLMSMTERPLLLFNQQDPDCNYNRISYMGVYRVQDGLPLNPRGRTGVTGRGILGRFGPNHAADPIVTRWKKTEDGSDAMDDGKRVLEFIAIQRTDNQQWAIPGGMVEPGHQVGETLLREFSEEALGELNKTEEERKALQEKVGELLNHGVEVYKGYVDDPRNTDNAWMETVAMNFHDGDGSVFAQLEGLLQAGDDAQGVRWQSISSAIPLFASHTAMLAKVAEIHNAAF